MKDGSASSGPVLRSAHLTLRPFRPSDLEPLRGLLGQLGTGSFFDSGGRPLSPAKLASKMVREAVAHAAGKDRARLGLAILPRGRRTPIGGALLACDVEGGAEVGLWFSPVFRGRGLGKEALALLLRHGRDALDRRRIRGVCAADNTASIRLMETCGMHFRHRLTAEDKRGHPVKLVDYAIVFEART